ncbi:hypothetical protein niasHS_011854 [Heterodera schachtii]|uniref:Secreted protein n=1 Tax=Heterodera schachtii TaxID=97005 RepID=A0ABD2INY3_HETSC
MVVKCSLLSSIFAVLLLFIISALLEHGHALNCKVALETETLKFKKQSKCPQGTHCAAIFCSSAENGFYTNMWSCFTRDANDTKAKCENDDPDKVNEFRANLSAPTATDLKCTCHFGAKDKDMDNEQFVSGTDRMPNI